jgi:hypothetical protein
VVPTSTAALSAGQAPPRPDFQRARARLRRWASLYQWLCGVCLTCPDPPSSAFDSQENRRIAPNVAIVFSVLGAMLFFVWLLWLCFDWQESTTRVYATALVVGSAATRRLSKLAGEPGCCALCPYRHLRRTRRGLIQVRIARTSLVADVAVRAEPNWHIHRPTPVLRPTPVTVTSACRTKLDSPGPHWHPVHRVWPPPAEPNSIHRTSLTPCRTACDLHLQNDTHSAAPVAPREASASCRTKR